MIKEIQCIYIIDNMGKPIFIQENYVQGSGNPEHALLSDFISALQSFAKEFGEEETRIVELSDAKIYSIRDKILDYLFIMKCNVNSKNKKMFEILSKIKNLFINKFLGSLILSEDEKKIIMSSFEEELNKLLIEPDYSLEGFFKWK